MVPDGGPYNTGCIYEDSPEHTYGCGYVYVHRCVHGEGVLTGEQYTHVETLEATDTDWPIQVGSSVYPQEFWTQLLPRCSWEGGWKDHKASPRLPFLSLNF